MLKNSTRLVVWALDSLLDLEEIKKLLVMDYKQSINFLDSFGNLSRGGKALQNKWVSLNDEPIKISARNILGKEFKYISEIGSCETS